MKKKLLLLLPIILSVGTSLHSQGISKQKNEIYLLVDKYSEAREKKDTVLLKNILTSDIDQLVSTGEWRTGMGEAVAGMMRSSAATPGTRTLKIDKLRFLSAQCAVADAKYDIQNADGTIRKMWSTFIVVRDGKQWKIAGIRNMLPAAN